MTNMKYLGYRPIFMLTDEELDRLLGDPQYDGTQVQAEAEEEIQRRDFDRSDPSSNLNY